MDEQTDRPMDRWAHGWTDGWMDRYIERWVIYRWIEGWMDGWIYRWMEGQSDRMFCTTQHGKSRISRGYPFSLALSGMLPWRWLFCHSRSGRAISVAGRTVNVTVP
jgi:hypothetical protein